MNALRGKVALITGASSGIGRATAVRLASLGVKVGLAARTTGALEEAAAEIGRAGGQALVLPTDVTDPEACRRAVDRVAEHHGRLDILVCSAGLSMRCNFDGSSLEAMERVLQVNYLGTLYPTYHAVPHVKATGGSLVAISSLVGKRGVPTYAAYGASKFAVQGLYESLRLELGPAGVHVGIFSPGHVATPLRDRVLGPDGQPWTQRPPSPFRVWPVEQCVERIVRLIVQRRPEDLFPPIVRPLLVLDHLVGTWLGDRWLRRRFGKAPLPEGP